MLRVAEEAHRTDTGRQRHANEDSYFARAPVFAVADGMGGAQAGEVASRIAAEAFEPQLDDAAPPERRLREIVEAANREIHEIARKDSQRAGMGTTLTAALLSDDELVLAHVGDSRAYLFRDGKLRQLTQDHSLVEELRRQGRLTAEQAEEHPQRSIITRALGPESSVDVDTQTQAARNGDIILLCSDGLTTMVDTSRIAQTLDRSSSLDEAVARLVEAANEEGGRDNITVVAFRIEQVEKGEDEGATLIGDSAAEAGLTAEAVRRGAEAKTAEREAAATAAPARGPGAVAAPPKRRWPGRILKSLGVLAILAAVAFLAALGTRQVYFLGTDDAGRVALYRGFPYDLPFGLHLYDTRYTAPVRVKSLPSTRRPAVTDHELRSRSDAVDLIKDVERSEGVRR